MHHAALVLNILRSLWVIVYSIPAMVISLYYCVATRPCKDIGGEVVMVTGAGQGLGRELCLSFARLGAQLVCVDLMPEVNQETVKMVRDLGAKARGYVCDVSDRTAIQKLAQEVGRVDILVNNAGIYPVKGLWNATEAEIRRVLDINLLSQFWTAQAFLPGMKERDHGHFVSISSVAGLGGLCYLEPYAVSKAGLTGLMLTLEHELRNEKKMNVKLTTVYPYFINTRPEIKTICDDKWPIPPVEVEVAAEEIVLGIRQDLMSFTVPKLLQSGFHLLNILPTTYRNKWFEIFYAPVQKAELPIDDHVQILNKKSNK